MDKIFETVTKKTLLIRGHSGQGKGDNVNKRALCFQGHGRYDIVECRYEDTVEVWIRGQCGYEDTVDSRT